MDSPFPGMDPYLEQHWRSVHHRLVTYAGDQLQAILPARFRVEVEERVFVAGEDLGGRSISPDVQIVETPAAAREQSSPGSTAIAPAILIDIADEAVTEIYLEVIDLASGNKVITAIEFLSPTNKTPGDGNSLYVRKQSEYRAAGVSQVEIDLTRTGDQGLVFPMNHVPAEHRTHYLACIRRGWNPMRIEAYPISLYEPLPTIGVPLTPSDDDVPLDLQSLVSTTYRNGRYADIDYRQQVAGFDDAADLQWIDQLLKHQGLR